MSDIINTFVERITKAGYPSNNNTWKKSGNKIYFTRYDEDYDISMTKEEQKFNTKFVNKLFSICDKMTKDKIAYYNVDENNKGKCVLTFTPFSKSIKESMIYGYMLEPIQEGIFDKLKKKNEKLRKEHTREEKSKLTPEERKKQYELCVNIVKEILAKYNNPKGITAGVGDDTDNLNDFINGGPRDNVKILSWDAWDGTNDKARNEEYYAPFMDTVNKIMKEVSRAIKANHNIIGRIIDDGDWDEGELWYETLK